MDEHSPPSSKKSSAISKVDLVETPRMSPYRTRSRKNSNLTEENIAMHNDSPTTRSATRRITRRMSQGSESAIVLTPMPPTTKRTRRSPSVASGDDVSVTPKKKFTVAQENVVMEEDETPEENKPQSPILIENGSSNVNEVDKENISKIVNGSIDVSEVTIEHKSPAANETNLVIEQTTVAQSDKFSIVATEPPAFTSIETVATDSESTAFNVLPVDVCLVLSESPKPIVSALGSDQFKKTSTVGSFSKSETVVSSNASVPVSKVVASFSKPETAISSSDPPHVVVASIRKSETGISSSEPGPVSTAVASIRKSEIANSSSEPVPAHTVVANTPDASLKNNVEKSTSEMSTKGEEKLGAIIKASATDRTDRLDNESHTCGLADLNARVFEESPPTKSNRSALDAIDVPSSPATSSMEVIIFPDTPLRIQKSAISDSTIPGTPLSTLKISMDVVTTPKTHLRTEESTTIVPDTPLSVPNTLLSVPNTPQAFPRTILDEEIIQETPKKQPSMAMTDSEEDILLKISPTPLKTNPIPSKMHTKKSDECTPTSSKTAPLPNGIQDANEEYPSKWGGSIRRKSDGQPIDKFGVMKAPAVEASTSITKTRTENISIVSVRNSSDDGSDEETASRNSFLDDEAMESNGEASMDEEERRYLEENEIPEDGISLGSESDKEMSDGNESNDSFVVSDSSVHLLDGSGDDLEYGNESVELDKSQSKMKRGNRISDTSDDELELEIERKKSSSKRLLDNSSINPVKHPKLHTQHNKVSESDEEDELANLDVEPRKTRSSKRLSESKTLSKQDKKRLSLHPNIKLSSLESNEEVVEQSTVGKSKPTAADDGSEEDVTEVLANLDDEPKNILRSRRHSQSMASSKKDSKRRSLHPNIKLSCLDSNEKENKLTNDEIGPPTADESSKEDVKEALANLDEEPKINKNSKRLSESNSLSKKDMKRLSLHPNTKLNALKSNEVVEEHQQSTITYNDLSKVDDTRKENELANLEAEPKKTKNSKSLSDSMTIVKKDAKRLSLHPNTKLNRASLPVQDEQRKSIMSESIVNTESSAGPTVDPKPLNKSMKDDQSDNLTESVSTPNSSQQKEKVNVHEIQAKCDAFLQLANEVKREEKLKNKGMPLQEDKYQRLKEKKTAKLQEKREKEARRLERQALAEKQRQLKREKKTKIAVISDEEKTKAIEKALAFGGKILATKNQHSSNLKEEKQLDESIKERSTNTTAVQNNKRKRKLLQILDEPLVQKKKVRRFEDMQISAKPEGFNINSLPVKSNKLNKCKETPLVQVTSAGSFQVEPLPAKRASLFTVTTLNYNPAHKFNDAKEKTIFNANVKRETTAELLRRKRRQRK